MEDENFLSSVPNSNFDFSISWKLLRSGNTYVSEMLLRNVLSDILT